MNSQRGHDPERITPNGCVSLAWKDYNISPLTYNGEVIEMTWPQVTDIKIWDIQVLVTLPLTQLWKFESVRKNTLAFARPRTSTIEHVRSDHVICPGDLTWPDPTRNTFFAKMCEMNVPTKSESFSSMAPSVWRWDRKTLKGASEAPRQE